MSTFKNPKGLAKSLQGWEPLLAKKGKKVNQKKESKADKVFKENKNFSSSFSSVLILFLFQSCYFIKRLGRKKLFAFFLLFQEQFIWILDWLRKKNVFPKGESI